MALSRHRSLTTLTFGFASLVRLSPGVRCKTRSLVIGSHACNLHCKALGWLLHSLVCMALRDQGTVRCSLPPIRSRQNMVKFGETILGAGLAARQVPTCTGLYRPFVLWHGTTAGSRHRPSLRVEHRCPLTSWPKPHPRPWLQLCCRLTNARRGCEIAGTRVSGLSPLTSASRSAVMRKSTRHQDQHAFCA